MGDHPEPRAANAGLLELITQFPGGEPQTRRRALLAAEEALSKGVTTFHDAGASFATIDVLRRMAEAGELPLRLSVMIAEPNEALGRRSASTRSWARAPMAPTRRSRTSSPSAPSTRR